MTDLELLQTKTIEGCEEAIGDMLTTHTVPEECVNLLKQVTECKAEAIFHVPLAELAEALLAAHGYLDGFRGENDTARNLYLDEMKYVQTTSGNN